MNSAALKTLLKAQSKIVQFGPNLVASLATVFRKILKTICLSMFIEVVRASSSRRNNYVDLLLLTQTLQKKSNAREFPFARVTCTDADDCNTFRYPDWVETPGNECPPGLCEQTTTTTSSTQPTISSSSSTESTVSSSESSTVSSTESTMSSSSSQSSTESTTINTEKEEDEEETDVGLILGATALALTVTAIGGAGVFFFCNRKSSKTNPDKI
ncbi:unnamed protein product [Oikopleura dioica]|uniref:Uncharacterized protein n=1 Tax=Oikopleura dioica TaxID=34765 RepID=E4XU57_OIKDI|nr:unnamed protein product [Oikopleura dioica]